MSSGIAAGTAEPAAAAAAAAGGSGTARGGGAEQDGSPAVVTTEGSGRKPGQEARAASDHVCTDLHSCKTVLTITTVSMISARFELT